MYYGAAAVNVGPIMQRGVVCSSVSLPLPHRCSCAMRRGLLCTFLCPLLGTRCLFLASQFHYVLFAVRLLTGVSTAYTMPNSSVPLS